MWQLKRWFNIASCWGGVGWNNCYYWLEKHNDGSPPSWGVDWNSIWSSTLIKTFSSPHLGCGLKQPFLWRSALRCVVVPNRDMDWNHPNPIRLRQMKVTPCGERELKRRWDSRSLFLSPFAPWGSVDWNITEAIKDTKVDTSLPLWGRGLKQRRLQRRLWQWIRLLYGGVNWNFTKTDGGEKIIIRPLCRTWIETTKTTDRTVTSE